MPKVVYSKEFNDCLRKLTRSGKSKQVTKARAAVTEAGTNGEIASLPRTHHGESRLPNIEKFDLGEAFRLVVQLVDGDNKIRAFLYVGDHEDTEAWLETHKNYKWTKKESDGTLEFVQTTERPANISQVPQFDLESPNTLLELPLLREISDSEWTILNFTDSLKTYVSKLTSEDWERDQSGIIDFLSTMTDQDTISLLIDLFHHAHQKEWSSLHYRIGIVKGAAHTIEGKEAAEAMLSEQNSESFIEWENCKDLFETHPDSDWADWMLFLHPEQKKLANRDLNGAARLRGVSGSGKTCVMVHRARYLAKKYNYRILVVTLTESMRKLLDNLLTELCGVEKSQIATATVSAFSKDLLRCLHPEGDRWYTLANPNMIESLVQECSEIVINHPEFKGCFLRQYPKNTFRQFLKDEIAYVRGRLLPSDYPSYVSKSFKRIGRAIALPESIRHMILPAIEHWTKSLQKYHQLDHEAIVQEGLSLLLSNDKQNPNCQWRCILVDEVQDLSQLELRILANITAPDQAHVNAIENGLFLVGDGAQTIYKKGFSLQSIGINVSNRSFAFKKNYRNTYEILLAAYGLIKSYEFADIDEDNFQKPLEPDYAVRHGEKPIIVKCANLWEEAKYCAESIKEIIEGNSCQPGQICVIGANNASRDAVTNALLNLKIKSIELKQDVDFLSPHVKISTIESAKGHEFKNVFIVGLVEGVLPLENEDISREAARLYVAMTRACYSLAMTYSSNAQHRPSQFLASILPYCTEAVYENGHIKPLEE